MAKAAYRDCVVSFIDILGFKELLYSTKEPHEISRLVRKVREALSPSSEKQSASDPKGLRWSKPFGFSLSDAVVRIRPYDTEYRDGALFYELLDLMHAQGELLYEGIIIRGAVTVGKAYFHRTDDMAFGPAVAEAYEWESTRAVYPRIVVTERAMEAYETDDRLRSESELSETMSLLTQGDDGLHYIDYLNKLDTEYDHYGSYLELLEKHRDVINENIAQHGRGSRIWQKYSWMRIQHNNVVSRLISASRNERNAEQFYREYGFDMGPYVAKLTV